MATHDDCRYWGLTLQQCVNHHYRLAGYYARRALRYADKADRHADKAQRALIVAAVALGISILLRLAAFAGRMIG